MRRRVSRRRFIALTGGAAGASALLVGCGDDSASSSETSEFGDGDVGILNFLLTIEQVEAAFYAAANQTSFYGGKAGTDKKVGEALGKFGEEEVEHVAALTKAIERLGGEPGAKPKTEFSLEAPHSVLTLATTLENLSAAGHLGQIPKIESSKALATVLSIHSVEGQHAATMSEFSGKPIAPDGAFATPATAQAVLESLQPFMAAEGDG